MHNSGLVCDFAEVINCEEAFESCEFGKFHRKSFPASSVRRATQKLE